MDEPQYAALSFSLTRTVLFLKEAALDSLLKHIRKITYKYVIGILSLSFGTSVFFGSLVFHFRHSGFGSWDPDPAIIEKSIACT